MIAARGRRLFGRTVLSWRFRLFGARRLHRVVLENVAGRSFVVLPQVFNPRLFRSGGFLAETLDDKLIPPGSEVLDLGTGSGVGAIVAARWASRVVAVDINPTAVRCARINALINSSDRRIEVQESDLFDSIPDERFDVVLLNPPFYRGQPRDDFDRAWRSVDLVERFADQLSLHLKPGGYGLVVLSTDGESKEFLRLFTIHGFAVESVADRRYLNETFSLYRLALRG